MTVRIPYRRVLKSTLIIYLVVCTAGAVVLCEIAVHPPRRTLDHRISVREISGGDEQLSIEDATVRASDGVALRGWFVRPQRYNGDVVIILHGVSDNRLSAAGFTAHFVPAGYAALMPDSRAHGESGGGFATYGVFERDDVRHWIDWLENKASPRCVYLLGESMGAAIAIQATAADRRICATVAESPFATFRDVAFERLGQMTNTGPWLGKTVGRPMVEIAFLLARLRSGAALTDASPKRAIAQTQTPILLIHGEADTQISPSASRTLHDAAPNHSEIWIVPRAEHCEASAVAPEEFHRRVLEWFEQHR